MMIHVHLLWGYEGKNWKEIEHTTTDDVAAHKTITVQIMYFSSEESYPTSICLEPKDVEVVMSTSVVIPTTKLGPDFEITVCACPQRASRDVNHVFPERCGEDLYVIATMQRSDVTLSYYGDKQEHEKDRLLERFMSVAVYLCDSLIEEGFWADYIDPSSGLPMIHQGTNNIYNEVSGMQSMLGYGIQNAGCCKILLHPEWGSAVYPARIFTNAPLEVLAPLIDSVVNSCAPSS